jgi:hypothetical protein
MRLVVLLMVALAAPVTTALAQPAPTDWSPQIPSLRLGPPLMPDTSLNVPGGYVSGTAAGAGSGGYQFGNNIAGPSGAFYAAFQKNAFPFRR